jgi:membrane fusion protein (multidrug efflux system)
MSRKLVILILGPLVLILLGLFFYLSGGRYVSTDNAYVEEEVTSMAAEVSGKVVQVNVKDNTPVSKGDVLFRIDPESFQIAVDRARANLNNIRADIESLRATYLQKKADLERAEESVHFNEKEDDRYTQLVKQQSVSREKADTVHHNLNMARKELEAAAQEMESLKARLDGHPDLPVEEHSAFRQANAVLAKALLDFDRTQVKAPVDGVTANVDMDPGEYILAGRPLFSLVDEYNPWVEANFKETDLTHVRPGQDAKIKVDTYPGEIWHAKVASITPGTGSEFSILPAENSSGNWVKVVQRIMVRLELSDNENKPPLRAGMSTEVTIDTGVRRLQRLFKTEN